MGVVEFDRRIAKPGTKLLQVWKLVLSILEGRWSTALRQILEQFGVPSRSLLSLRPDDTGHDLSIQEEVIGARRELNEAIGHEQVLSAWSCRSTIHKPYQ